MWRNRGREGVGGGHREGRTEGEECKDGSVGGWRGGRARQKKGDREGRVSMRMMAGSCVSVDYSCACSHLTHLHTHLTHAHVNTHKHTQVIPSLEMLSVVRAAVDAWSSLTHHPGLCVPVEGFVATELDGSSPSLVVVNSYVPGAVTLAQAHLQPTQVIMI